MRIAMKVFFTLLSIMAGALVPGCAIGHKLVLDTVGPAPAPPTITASTASNGTLLVYSAFRRNADFNRRDPYRQEYSDYEIFTAEGKRLRNVHNNSGTMLQDAVPVPLAPGKYNVVARANGYGYVTIPVMIVAPQTTVLHLEGGGVWPNESAFNGTNTVRLPDGQIIGWKAETDLNFEK